VRCFRRQFVSCVWLWRPSCRCRDPRANDGHDACQPVRGPRRLRASRDRFHLRVQRDRVIRFCKKTGDQSILFRLRFHPCARALFATEMSIRRRFSLSRTLLALCRNDSELSLRQALDFRSCLGAKIQKTGCAKPYSEGTGHVCREPNLGDLHLALL
jgi:hypothetical protein